MIRTIIFGILPVSIGGLIYLTYRTDTLLMFKWFDNFLFSEIISLIRSNHFIQSIPIPEWFKFSIPDAFWLFSFTYFLLKIWEFKICFSSIIWILLTPLIGILSEIAQLTGLLPGTFDIIDLIFLIFASIFPLFFLKKT